MSRRILRVEELSDSQWSAWRSMHQAVPGLDSPFFHPRFVQILRDIGRPVLVLVDETNAGPLFFPFEREGRLGRPAGWPLNDFQSPIAAPGASLDVVGFLRDAGLRNLLFDHLLADRREFAPYVEKVADSPFLDVSGGLTSYRDRLRRSQRDEFSMTQRRGRKAGREIGPLRQDYHVADRGLLEILLAWKRQQYIASAARDPFALEWPIAVLQRLLEEPGPEFSAALSALYAGDHLLAVHFGLRAGPVLHWWFPAYDAQYGGYSPGRIQLMKLVEAAPGLGLKRIDLGKGDSAYKHRAMTGATPVCEGFIETRPLHRWSRLGIRRAEALLRASPLFPRMQALKRRLLDRSSHRGSPRPRTN